MRPRGPPGASKPPPPPPPPPGRGGGGGGGALLTTGAREGKYAPPDIAAFIFASFDLISTFAMVDVHTRHSEGDDGRRAGGRVTM